MSKANELIIILILLALASLTEIAVSQVEFSDQDKWAPVFESNASYNDWTVYQRSIPGLETISPIEIENISPGKSFFDWKTDRVSDHVDISFSVNGLPQASCKSKSWTRVYFYKIKAEDKLELTFWVREGGPNVNLWIAFPQQNYTPENTTVILPSEVIPAPKLPNGNIFGYVGKKYNYSINVDTPSGKDRNEFDWGDDSFSNTSCNGEANHTWTKPGEYKVRTRTWTEKNHHGNWSKPLAAIIYLQMCVSDDLQRAIDHSENYTELILMNPTYYGPVDIHHKHNLTIESSKNYVNLTGSNIENSRMIIDGSQNITITHMNLSNSKIGVKIKGSLHTKFIDNDIHFTHCWFGLTIEGGEFNWIQDNRIQDNIDSEEGNSKSCGIALKDTTNNIIQNNKIFSPNNELTCHYYLENSAFSNNTIIFSDLDFDENQIIVKQGQCECRYYDNELYCQIKGSAPCSTSYRKDKDPNKWSF